MENRISFQDYAIVACGTVNLELNYLRDSGFLDVRKILYTKPGRHEVSRAGMPIYELNPSVFTNKGRVESNE